MTTTIHPAGASAPGYDPTLWAKRWCGRATGREESGMPARAPENATTEPRKTPAAQPQAGNASDLFAQIASVATEYGIDVREAGPISNIGIPFFNPNTGGAYFTTGFVRDEQSGNMLPASWFFETPTNDVDRRLQAYVEMQNGGPASALYSPGDAA